MPIRLTRGTIEVVEVQVTDMTNTVTSLATSTPKFDIIQDDGTPVVTAQTATASGMLIHCLCDTEDWPEDEAHLNLYTYFVVGSQHPRFGPFDVYMVE